MIDPYIAIFDEVTRARRLFPFADGLMAALTEEVGELAKAMLDESPERVRAEAIQVAAMAIRIAAEGDPTLNAYRAAQDLPPTSVVKPASADALRDAKEARRAMKAAEGAPVCSKAEPATHVPACDIPQAVVTVAGPGPQVIFQFNTLDNAMLDWARRNADGLRIILGGYFYPIDPFNNPTIICGNT